MIYIIDIFNATPLIYNNYLISKDNNYIECMEIEQLMTDSIDDCQHSNAKRRKL